ncbi:MAG: aspartyl/glutamyl-tRNA amidotransferase subunit B [Gammaproteobacteria bacterium TMED78]|nr:MAG: aspartyl/glutamyl-tRNA amidotransferase subunit B [Gammaproteobacteria bacterium TMED78]|tara:strand:- start:9712 stop:11145 length:1434 start_codon:yes stop_codon:yes gene_type:complete
MNWEIVIGLEIHTQLATKSKLFSGASTKYGAPPNTQASIIDLGYPGVLPVFNKEALIMAIKFGLATNCKISPNSIFARKNYFYPDLPKGYQISQYEHPIVYDGNIDIEINSTTKNIKITRAHLEEDAGKSLHQSFDEASGVDLNRAGTPLLEIVSEPDIRSAIEAGAYMRKIHKLVCYLGISDGNMQEGSFRCDANVSIREKGDKKLGTRTEIKNLNSFRFVEKAIELEAERQIELIENGQIINQETRLYDDIKNETRSMRSKEEANDYRYFPDPDLLPITIDDELINKIKENLPELPEQKYLRFISEYDFSEYDSEVLTSNIDIANFFEGVFKKTKSAKAKLISNWIQGELLSMLNTKNIGIKECKISTEDFAKILDLIEEDELSSNLAKEVLHLAWGSKEPIESIIEKNGYKLISDDNIITKIIDDIVKNFPEQVEQYKNGNQKIIGFFVGKAMQAAEGKVNPKKVNQLLKKKLG